MEINQVDNEVKDLITRKSVYGMETLINAIMRAAVGRPYIDREYIHRMVDNAIDRAMQDKEDLINGKD